MLYLLIYWRRPIALFAGDEVPVKRLSVADLLPATHHYMTYDGSTTVPACHETVTWLILNKPIYITKQQVKKNNMPFSGHPRVLGVLTRSTGLIAGEIKFNRKLQNGVSIGVGRSESGVSSALHPESIH